MSLAPRTKLFKPEAEIHARDHERRLLGLPGLHPLNRFNTTDPDLPPLPDRPFSSMQWEAYRKGEYADCGRSGKEGHGETYAPYRAAVPLDAQGVPAMHEKFLARISAAGNANRPPRPRAWLTVAEVAYLRDLKESAVRDAISRGNLHAVRTDDGGPYRVSMASFEAWCGRCGHTGDEVTALMAEARAMRVTV